MAGTPFCSGKAESDIRDAILEYLRKSGWKCVFRDKQYPGRRRHNYPESTGVADILACRKGKFVAIEVKRPEGKLTVEQYKFLENVREEGGIAIVATSVDDVTRERW